MQRAIVIAVLASGCGPTATTAVAVEPPTDTKRADDVAQRERHVVVMGGAPIFDVQDAERPRGTLGEPRNIGGWTMRVVEEVGDRVRVSADLGGSFENCAREVEGLRGLDVEVFVPRSALATIITREVTLTAPECDSIVAHPGVMVTPLCEADGVKRYRVGSCPNAECLYAVPDDAIGTSYSPRPHGELGTPIDDEMVPMPCLERIDAEGRRRAHAVPGAFGGLPATGLSKFGEKAKDGGLPACELETTSLSCDIRPRLGFDHVQYELDEGTKVAWRDGSSAGVAKAPHRFRAVPRDDGERACWGAIEGESSSDDVLLCAPADAIRRLEEPHAVILQARRDGDRSFWRDATEATACYREALAKSPALAGRVHATFRAEKGVTSLVRVARSGDEAFARCLAAKLDADSETAYSLDVTIELYPAITGSAGRPRAPADGSRPSRDRSPSDRRR
jgi:hypothetical protein